MADGAVFLAVDLGAGSGRIIAGLMLEGRLSLEEVYRFENEPFEEGGNLYWDFEKLWAGVVEGLRLSVVRFCSMKKTRRYHRVWGGLCG